MLDVSINLPARDMSSHYSRHHQEDLERMFYYSRAGCVGQVLDDGIEPPTSTLAYLGKPAVRE